MEAIKNITETANQRLRTGSNSTDISSTSIPPRQSLGISREKITAMLTVLNKRWLSMGWRAMDPADSEPMALVWIETLDSVRAPYQHYEDLYRRAIGLRTRRLQAGLKCEDFSAEMMAACWIGENGLAAELERKRIESRKFLPDVAASQCQRCFGAGMEVVPGKGARPCNHEAI